MEQAGDPVDEADAQGEHDGPCVVGAEYREPDGPVSRRDRPARAPWTRAVPPGAVPDDYVAKSVPARPMSMRRLILVALLIVFLVGTLVDFVVTAVGGESIPADMALRLVYGALIQFVGWWTVIHLIRDR